MKKAMIALLAAALLLQPLAGQAETDYVSLSVLREQAAEGWHETYQSHGREAAANVEIGRMPETDACPVYRVESLLPGEDALAALQQTPGVKAKVYSGRVLDINLMQSPFWLCEYYGDTDTDQEIDCYNGAEPAEDALACDLTYAQWKEKINGELTALLGLTLRDFRFDVVNVNGPLYRAKKRDGVVVRGEQVTASGCYSMRATQLLGGIPVLDSFAEDTPAGYLVSNYRGADNYVDTFACSRIVSLQEADVPLLSFEAMKAALEKQIEAGTMRGIDEMEFGYLICYQKTADGRQYVTVPVWRVLGGYSADLNKEHVMPYYDERDTDGSLSVPIGYRDYFYNAQTGEMIQTCALTDTLAPIPAGEILTWDSI